MKKKKNIIIFIIILIIGTTGTIYYSKKENKNAPSIPATTVKKEDSKDEKIEKILNDMTIEEKIAQMFIVYYNKNTVDDELKELIVNTKPGGFILMQENYTTYNKTKKFISDIKKYSEIPPIISTDQEGGIVQRLQYLSDVNPTYIPYMYNLGKTKNQELAYNVGKVIAEELRTLGINVTYAPVVDVYSNKNNTVIGKRSFSTDTTTVSKMAISLATGLEDNKVIATYKHFPGHGDTATDSHINVPIINKTIQELSETELVPFLSAIHNDAKIIMIGHIALPKITNNNTPATLSKEIVTGILKDKLQYQGLIITDALNMGAITKNYSEKEVYTKAVEAGVDLLLMPKDLKKGINIIKENISEERINESVRKILKFKYTYLTEDNSLDKSYLGNKDHQNIINQIK